MNLEAGITTKLGDRTVVDEPFPSQSGIHFSNLIKSALKLL